MKNLSIFLLTALISLGMYSCDKEDVTETSFEHLKITSVDMPDTFVMDETYEIAVSYNRPDGCTYLQGFDIIPVDQTEREIEAIGIRYEDEICTQVIEEATDQFLFQVIYDQPYTFKFFQGQDSTGNAQFLTVEVPVQ